MISIMYPICVLRAYLSLYVAFSIEKHWAGGVVISTLISIALPPCMYAKPLLLICVGYCYWVVSRGKALVCKIMICK